MVEPPAGGGRYAGLEVHSALRREGENVRWTFARQPTPENLLFMAVVAGSPKVTKSFLNMP